MSEWISVEDKMPNNNKNVLMFIVYQRMSGGIYSEDEIIMVGGFEDGEWYAGNKIMMWDYTYNLDFTSDDVTHWMPLPAPPTKEE